MFVEQEGEEVVGDLADAFVNDGVAYVFVPWVREFREVSRIDVFPPIPEEMEPVEYFATILEGIAERADPFIKRRLLKLAERYAVKGIRREPAPGTERPLPIPRPRLHVVRGPEEG